MNEGKVYGYESYDTKELSVRAAFRGKGESWKSSSMTCDRYMENLLCVDHDVLAYSRFSTARDYRLEVNILDHPEVLKNAKKLYVHPSCNISRDLVRKKYQRVLNIAAADAVVIPSNHDETYLHKYMLIFVNDETTELYVCDTRYSTDSYYRNTFPYYIYNQTYEECVNNIGIKVRDITTICRDLPEEILNAELIYAGPVTTIGTKQQYIFDYLTGLLPKERIVLERDVLKTLGDETNVPTVDSMMNIYEMMKSADRAVRELGFKTLATMDYINYPESTRLILDNTDWYMDNNYKPSAVRFMLDSLEVKICRRRRASQSTQISQKDWDIAKELVKRIKNLDDKQFIRYCTYNIYYTYIDDGNVVHPRPLKEEQ